MNDLNANTLRIRFSNGDGTSFRHGAVAMRRAVTRKENSLLHPQVYGSLSVRVYLV